MGAEDQAVAEVGAAVGHIVALWAADFVAGEVGWGEELDFGDDDGFVLGGDGVWGSVRNLVGSDEEGVCGGMENACFVKVWSSRVRDEKGKGWRRAEQVQEGIMVNEEWTGLRRSGREQRRGLPGTVSVASTPPIYPRRVYCHNASLWRFTRCQARLSDHGCWGRGRPRSLSARGDSKRGDEERESFLLVEGRLLSRLEDLDESEKETLGFPWPVPSASTFRCLCQR